MTIVVAVLFVTVVWIFLAAVLGGCGGKAAAAGRDSRNVFGGEFWLWERADGGVRLRRGEPGVARRAGPARSDRPAVPSLTA